MDRWPVNGSEHSTYSGSGPSPGAPTVHVSQHVGRAPHVAVVTDHTTAERHTAVLSRLHDHHLIGRTRGPEGFRLAVLLFGCKEKRLWLVSYMIA